MQGAVSERMFDEIFDVFWESEFRSWLHFAESMKAAGGGEGPLDHLSKIPDKKQKSEMKFLFNMFYRFLKELDFFIGDKDYSESSFEGKFIYLLKKNIKQSTTIDRIKRRFATVQAELKKKKIVDSISL